MMRLPINRIKTHLPDNSIHVPGFTAGWAGGFSVWSPRPPARPPIAFSAIGYYNPAYSLTARSGCPIDWVHRQDLTHDDISFLFRKDILSDKMLTDSINGIFTLPDLQTKVKTLIGGISRPGLLLKLNAATTAGTKIFKHYLAYPPKWDPAQFETWKERADKLFSATVK